MLMDQLLLYSHPHHQCHPLNSLVPLIWKDLVMDQCHQQICHKEDKVVLDNHLDHLHQDHHHLDHLAQDNHLEAQVKQDNLAVEEHIGTLP